MNNILALDLGVRTGWAREAQGVIDSGTEIFEREDGGTGERFFKFNEFLREKCLDGSSPQVAVLDRVVYETPLGRFAKSQAQVYLTIGFATRIQEFCWRHSLTYNAIPIMTLKKFMTGSGSAGKPEMMKAASEWVGFEVTCDDRADALALLKYAKENRN